MPKDKKSSVAEESEVLTRLRDLLREEKDLNCPLDDEFLLRFIRAKKLNVEAAFKSVQSYYKVRENFPEILPVLNPGSFKKQFEKQIYNVLPNKNSNGQRVVLFKTRKWDLDDFSLDDILIGFYLITEEMTSYKDAQNNGFVTIMDHGGISFSQMRRIVGQLSIKQIKKLIGFYQGAFPAKFKGFHIVNHPRIFDMMFMLGRPFMKDKLKERIHEHGYNVQKLHAFFSLDMLPQSLGGNVPDDECEDSEFMNRFFGRDEYYKEMAKYGYRKIGSERQGE